MDNKIIGLIAVVLCFIGAISYVLFVEGGAGGFGNILSLPSFGFVVGVGGGLTYMRKHTLKEKELGKALKKDFILAGWLGFMVGCIYIGAGMDVDTNLSNLGGGFAAATVTVIYGYLLGAIAESFMTK